MASFDAFRDSLRRLGGVVEMVDKDTAPIRSAVDEIERLRSISTASLARLVTADPQCVRVLGLCAGLSQEQLKNVLRQWFGTSSYSRVASGSALDLVKKLEEEFGVLRRIRDERKRAWTYGDIIIERFRSRSRAAGSIERGRGVEDQVEAVVQALGLPYEMRTRFEGRRPPLGRAPIEATPPGGPRTPRRR